MKLEGLLPPSEVPILSQINPVHTHPTFWRLILILSFHLRLCHPSGLFPSGLSTKNPLCTYLSPLHATFPAHLFILVLIFGEE